MAVPLPPNPYYTTTQFIVHGAYERCLSLEVRHDRVLQCSDMKVLVCARFLGRMILEAPEDEGREYVASEVNRCPDDDELQGLAEVYTNHLLCIFFRNQHRTDVPTIFSASREKSKQNALVRDLHRCIFSKKYDWCSFKNRLAVDDGETQVTVTEASHIFNITTNENIGTSKQRAYYNASVIALLYRFGRINVTEELNGPRVHRLENILTFNADYFFWFHELAIWLERDPADNINQYKLCSGVDLYRKGLPDVITLTTPDPLTLPLPDPRYLALHAACARVVHLSGAMAYINKVLSDLEEIGVLSSDRSSDVLLHHALAHCQLTEI